MGNTHGGLRAGDRNEQEHGNGIHSYLRWQNYYPLIQARPPNSVEHSSGGRGSVHIVYTRIYTYNNSEHYSLEQAIEARRNHEEEFISQGDESTDLGVRVERYQAALKINPNNVLIQCRMREIQAQIAINNGNYEEAIQLCDKALTFYDGWTAKDLRERARIEKLIDEGNRAGDLAERVRLYEDVLRISPNNNLIQCRIREVQADILRSQREEAIRSGNTIERDRIEEKMIAILREAISCFPEAHTARVQLCRIREDRARKMIEEDNYANAIEECKEGLRYFDGMTARNLRDIAENRLRAVEFNESGEKYYAALEYEEALASFREAAGLNPSNQVYEANIHNVQAQLYIKERKYDAAIVKARQALSINPNNEDYKLTHSVAEQLEKEYNAKIFKEQEEADIKAAEESIISEVISFTAIISEMITAFDEIIEKDSSDKNDYSDIEMLCLRMRSLLDNEGYEEPAIVNRLLILEMRLSRYNLERELRSSTNDIAKLRNSVMNLLEHELQVVDSLGVSGDFLRKKLEVFENELVEEEKKAEDLRLNLIQAGTSLLALSNDIDEQARNTVSEPTENLLNTKNTYKSANSLFLRNFLVGDLFESYCSSGISAILKLRIASLGLIEKADLLNAIIIDKNDLELNLVKLASTFLQRINKDKPILIPLIILGDGSDQLNHWIGIIGEKVDGKVHLTYLDSEKEFTKSEVGGYFISSLNKAFTSSEVLLRRLITEQQRYNNCGIELIENFVLYLTGSRLSQEQAPFLHSYLWEQNLIFDFIEQNYKLNDKKNWQLKTINSAVNCISK